MSRKDRIVLKVSKNNVPLFIVCCQAVLAAWTAHQAQYAGAPITPAGFGALITNLVSCQQAVKNHVFGAVGPRNQARDALFTAVESLRIFVQGLSDASPEQALTLAQGVGMKLAAAPARTKPALGVKDGPQPGSVALVANAKLLDGTKARRCFAWEYSTDGKTWIAAPATPVGKTTITGLTSLTNYRFRVSVTTRNGQGAWSPEVSFLVK
jgi:hypothetical protein